MPIILDKAAFGGADVLPNNPAEHSAHGAFVQLNGAFDLGQRRMGYPDIAKDSGTWLAIRVT
jgi:hypothetical protein